MKLRQENSQNRRRWST